MPFLMESFQSNMWSDAVAALIFFGSHLAFPIKKYEGEITLRT